jgi:hypothetical protein
VGIVYIDPKDTHQIYVEVANLKPLLFLAHQKYIDEKFYGGMILEIYRGTIGVVYIVSAIFAAMGFIPVLIEEGFAGLIYEVILFYTTSKIEEQAEQINPVFAQVLGILLQTFAPRPNFKPKVVGPASVKRDANALSDVLNGPANRETQGRAIGEPNRATASSGTGSAGTASRTAPSSESKGVQLPLRQRPAANANVSKSAVLDEAAGEAANLERGERPAAKGAETATGGARPSQPKGVQLRRPPAANANVSESVMLDEVVEEIANLQRAEELAVEEEEGRIAMAGGGKRRGGSRASPGRVESSTRASGGGSRGAIGSRGTKDRSVPKPPPQLYPKYKLKFGALERFVEKASEIYRSEMARLKSRYPNNVAAQSTEAHYTTLQKMRGEYKNVVSGKQRYGVSDTGAKGKLVVRESDVAYYDPELGGDKNFNAVIELKSRAWVGEKGSILTPGGDLHAGVSSAQMQSYEILMDNVGVPVFVISGDGRIYSRTSRKDGWIQVGG